jgi:hypothetical protein
MQLLFSTDKPVLKNKRKRIIKPTKTISYDDIKTNKYSHIWDAIKKDVKELNNQN